MTKKIKLNKLSSNRRLSKEDRQNIDLSSKSEELSQKNNSETVVAPVIEKEVKIEKVEAEVNVIQKDDKITKLLNQLPEKNKFVTEGMRQQSSINTSDYTNCLINLLIEAKLQEGEKIRKTSYLEKYLIKGLKAELKDLGIEV
tara:strand:+ start:30080 stop:30508 length:429 start_codon:yes stop_codon:yes gene_type:complete